LIRENPWLIIHAIVMTSRTLILLTAALIAQAALAAPGKKIAAKPRATPAPLLSTELEGDDILFLKNAAECDALIVQLGDLGMARATMPEVRGLGEVVAQSYAQQAAELRALADHKQAAVGAGNVRVDTALAALKGLKFDKALVEQLAVVQGRALDAFELARASHDSDVRAFAEANTPKVRVQLIVARRILGEAGPSASPTPVPAK
jgi:putative NIF3 family GTP cyclohydrolase 1 type 2